MQYYQSYYEFNALVNHYQSDDLQAFNKMFNETFNTNSQIVKEKLKVIRELITESVNTHEYVTQILLENVEQIKVNPAKTKVKNLIDELMFAQLAYKESFEKDASEIDDVENLLIEWNRLLKLNKQLCVFMFSQLSFSKAQPIIEMLIVAKDMLNNGTDLLKIPLKSLYNRQSENLSLYNTICQMNENASKIHKNY